MPDLGPIAGALLELAGPALAAFLRTTVGMALFGVLAAGGSFVIASGGAHGSAGRGGLAAVVALVLCLIIGGVLAVKRAGLGAARRGLAQLGLGRRVLGLVFDGLLGVSDGAHGERGGALARTVERLPLADAEARLSAVVARLLGEDGGGFFASRIRALLLGKVQALTLTRFRQEGKQHGGVDLAAVRADLSTRVDETLVAQIDGILLKVTAGLVLLAGCLSLGFAVLLRGR